MIRRPYRAIAAAVVGVRPQYIKAAALAWEMQRWNRHNGTDLELVILDTAQHYDETLRRRVLEDLRLKPSRTLVRSPVKENLPDLDKTLDWVCASVREQEGVSGIVVFGDANPTLIGTLASIRLSLPLIHIEAGARRDVRDPEFFNSYIADAAADLKLCVSQLAMRNLATEGFLENSYWTGDMAVRWLQSRSYFDSPSAIENFSRRPILVTLHRPLNMSQHTMNEVARGLSLCRRRVVWIVHPRSRGLISSFANRYGYEIIEPLSHSEMIQRIRESAFILSDAGGVIREAHLLKKRVLVLREAGGWPELIDAGFNIRVEGNSAHIREALQWAESADLEYSSASPLVREGGVGYGIAQIMTVLSQATSS